MENVRKHIGTFFSLCFLFLLLNSQMALAQQRNTVKGIVIDEKGEPIIGASVQLKGSTTIGTITDLDGAFSLDIPKGGKILVVLLECLRWK